MWIGGRMNGKDLNRNGFLLWEGRVFLRIMRNFGDEGEGKE